MEDFLETYGVTKVYGITNAIHNVTLKVRQGEILVILGPSGSGKSTLLKVVAGIIDVSEGRILLRGNDITNIPIHERKLGLLMQGYSLFPHLTAYDNVAYPLRTKVHRCSASELRRRVSRMFELTGLVGLEGRKPHQLSGGQQQRVALARALVFDPDVLLLDEPLGALDRELRERMELEIRKIQRMLGTTVLYVTHDQSEAMSVADRIAILRNGSVVQVGTPVELYQQPDSQFVAQFLGGANLLKARTTSLTDRSATVQTAVGDFVVPTRHPLTLGETLTLMVRPEQLHLDAPKDEYNRLSGTLVDLMFLGNTWRATVALPDDTLWCLNLAPEYADENLKPDRLLDLYWKVSDGQLLADESVPGQ